MEILICSLVVVSGIVGYIFGALTFISVALNQGGKAYLWPVAAVALYSAFCYALLT